MRIDIKAIFLAVWLPALWWSIAVAGATLSGYPGVVCVTPLGWLLGLNVGQRCVQYSTTPGRSARIVEAAAAGVALGLFQGILFSGVLLFATPMGIPGENRLDALGMAAIALLVGGAGGALATGLLSAIMGMVMLRKIHPQAGDGS
jgi:hypothetical protein